MEIKLSTVLLTLHAEVPQVHAVGPVRGEGVGDVHGPPGGPGPLTAVSPAQQMDGRLTEGLTLGLVLVWKKT